MDKIIQIKTSFERLVKVWISKLGVNEQDIVAEDLIWIDSIFDEFFNENNLNEFINRDGRYQEIQRLSEIDFSNFLNSTIEYNSNKPEKWARLKVEEPNQFEFYRQLNEFNSNNYKNYNVIDIYFRLLKTLYYLAVQKDLIKTKSIVLSRILSAVQKISVFEKKGFNSNSLLSDLYFVVIKNLLTSKEIREDEPDEEFISMLFFKSTFIVYYLPLFKFPKVTIAKDYLLSIWVYLNKLGKDYILDEYLHSLSGMTLSISSYREIDIYDIRAMLRREELDSNFHRILLRVNSKTKEIILLNDLNNFFLLLEEAQKVEPPLSIRGNIVEYFLYDEKTRAIELYKFRVMQSLVLEFLGIVLHFKEVDYFFKSIKSLRKNEQWSNHLKFFPQSNYDLILWLILLKNIKFQMMGRFEPSFGYKYLNQIIIFLFKDIEFDPKELRQSLVNKELLIDSTFLDSMINVSKEVLQDVNQNVLIKESEQENQIKFWESVINWFKNQIKESEITSPLTPDIFYELKTGVWNRYKDLSLIYFLSKNLTKFNRKGQIQHEFGTRCIAADLQYRKYLIPNWFVSSYGLVESIGNYLVEQESMQLDFNFFQKQIPEQKKELTRKEIKPLFDKMGENCLFIFRNSFPDFWLKRVSNEPIDTDSESSTFPSSIFRYSTFDGISELIIIPKTSMMINYVRDGRLISLEFLEDTLMCEFLDLGNGNYENIKYLKSIDGFQDRFNLPEEELERRFWIRVISKTKILVRDKSSILRFKLNPYGE